MLEQDIRFLAEELEKGKLVVFVGAGVSKNSGLPEWEELIKDYADYRGIKEFTSKEYLTIPEEVFERYGSLKYYEIAEKRFSGKYFLAIPGNNTLPTVIPTPTINVAMKNI